MPNMEDMTKEQLEQELMKRNAIAYAKEGAQVTVLIPCRNAWQYLARSLPYLLSGAQSLPMRLHTADQDSDDNLTPVILERLGPEVKKYGIEEYKFIGQVRNYKDNLIRNMCLIRAALSKSVETPFALFLDADVCLPVGAARTMLEKMLAEPELGILGIPYRREVDHIQGGCTMIRTTLLQKLEWRPDECECKGMCKEAIAQGFRVEHLEGWFARDLKQEFRG